MKVLYLTSHVDGHQPFYDLQTMPEVQIVGSIKEGKLEKFPDDYELGISFLYHHKIPASELTDSHTWINFHPAPLPEYRGRNLAYHAIMNGETEFGATLHYMDESFDTGDIIIRPCFPIEECDTAGDVARKARRLCLKLFNGCIQYFLRGEKIIGYPQGKGTYHKHTPINPYIELTEQQRRQVRAITADSHFAKTMIGGVEYVIRPSASLDS